jgi:hypothetical protein
MGSDRQRFSTVACPFGCDWSWVIVDFAPPHSVQHYVVPATGEDSIVVMGEVNGLIPQVTVSILRRHAGQLSPNFLFKKSHTCPKITRG